MRDFMYLGQSHMARSWYWNLNQSMLELKNSVHTLRKSENKGRIELSAWVQFLCSSFFSFLKLYCGGRWVGSSISGTRNHSDTALKSVWIPGLSTCFCAVCFCLTRTSLFKLGFQEAGHLKFSYSYNTYKNWKLKITEAFTEIKVHGARNSTWALLLIYHPGEPWFVYKKVMAQPGENAVWSW
jgi:hypothetical protein